MSVETLGAAGGLFIYAFFQELYQNQGLVISYISLLTVVSVAALVLFPETRGRELESISQDAVAPDP